MQGRVGLSGGAQPHRLEPCPHRHCSKDDGLDPNWAEVHRGSLIMAGLDTLAATLPGAAKVPYLRFVIARGDVSCDYRSYSKQVEDQHAAKRDIHSEGCRPLPPWTALPTQVRARYR